MSATDAPQVAAVPDAPVDAAAPAGLEPTGPELIIRQRTGWIPVDWRELLRYRELLYFLVWRDVKVRYKQAVLGFAWAVLAPIITVSIFTLIFGRAGGFASFLPDGVPYFVYIFAGFIPWMMLSSAISSGGMSLVNQQNLLTKIYMPRLFIPSSVIGSSLVDMGIALVVFVISMIFARVTPAWTIIFVPFLILLTMVAAAGFSFTLSAMTVSYRDVRFLIPFIVQLLMLLSAVAFPRGVLDKYPLLLYANPIAGIIHSWRAAIFRDVVWHPGHLALSIVMVIALFVFGVFYFRKTERRFADIA
jgi:lipopolysaccharide transport system permease protein